MSEPAAIDPLAILPQARGASDPYVRAAETFPRLRAGSIKRVASAVGEGSVVVSAVHRSLAGV